jgi:hypothetical protein
LFFYWAMVFGLLHPLSIALSATFNDHAALAVSFAPRPASTSIAAATPP